MLTPSGTLLQRQRQKFFRSYTHTDSKTILCAKALVLDSARLCAGIS